MTSSPPQAQPETAPLQDLLAELVAIEEGLKTSTVSFSKERLNQAIRHLDSLLEGKS